MDKKRITFSMSMELYSLLKAEADQTGVPVNGMINVAIKEYIKQGTLIQLTELYKKDLDSKK